jgi:hypothetical protein
VRSGYTYLLTWASGVVVASALGWVAVASVGRSVSDTPWSPLRAQSTERSAGAIEVTFVESAADTTIAFTQTTSEVGFETPLNPIPQTAQSGPQDSVLRADETTSIAPIYTVLGTKPTARSVPVAPVPQTIPSSVEPSTPTTRLLPATTAPKLPDASVASVARSPKVGSSAVQVALPSTRPGSTPNAVLSTAPKQPDAIILPTAVLPTTLRPVVPTNAVRTTVAATIPKTPTTETEKPEPRVTSLPQPTRPPTTLPSIVPTTAIVTPTVAATTVSTPTTTQPVTSTSLSTSSPVSSTVAPTTAQTGSAAYSLALGSVGVRCVGNAVSLDFATPASGATIRVSNAGPEEIELRFTRGETVNEFHAVCRSGVPSPS